MLQTRLSYEFDDFRVESHSRKLLRCGQIVPLPSKAFELLLVLIRNRGRLLTKAELFELVWPDQIVEESNLPVNMSAIRRALEERASNPRYITTISGRGYRFTGDVREIVDEELTIEQESFTRIVTEEEEFELGAGTATVPTPAAFDWRRLTFGAVTCGVMLLSLSVASPWLYHSWNHRASASSNQPPNMHNFATQGGVPFRAVISRDGKSVVYVQRINGSDSLWLGQIKSNSSVKIDEEPGIFYRSLTISPDGAAVYAGISEGRDSVTKLMRMPIVGGVKTEILSDLEDHVSFSPDGRRLAFLRREEEAKRTSILIADADGRNERILATREAPYDFVNYGPSWSPDGHTIAIGARSGKDGDVILGINVADGSLRRISNRAWGMVGAVEWLPDGQSLAVSACEVALTRRFQIWRIGYPDGETRKMANDLDMYLPETLSISASGTVAALLGHNTFELWVAPNGDLRHPHLALQGVEPRYEGVDGLAWTADGNLIYSAYAGDAETIWKIGSDGRNLQQLTSNSVNHVDRYASATRDGRYLVFQSNRSGALQIWRANRDGTELKQLTTEGINYQASTSPDSRWVVYVSNNDGRLTLCRVSIDGGQPTQLSDRSASWPEISVDGKYIAYLENFDSRQQGRLAIMPSAGGADVKTFPLPASLLFVTRVSWTPDGRALMYKDSIQGIWRQALSAEKPEQLKGFEGQAISQFAWSQDGRNLVYDRGAIMRDIVLFDNFK